MAAFGCFVGGLPMTHEAISMAQPELRRQAEVYLEGNPEMCQTILRLGKSSSSAGLLLIYGQMFAAVLPVAFMEVKSKRATDEDRE